MSLSGIEGKEHFKKNYLSTNPMSTNVRSQGFSRRKVSEALDYRFIENSPRNSRNLIVLDVDSDEAEWELKTKIYDDKVIPEPSWITINPETNHAQAGYVINGFASNKVTKYTAFDGVASTFVEESSAVRFLKHVQSSVSFLAGADLSYSNFYMRNPLHRLQSTLWLTDYLYNLHDFDAFLVSPEDIKAKKIETGIGRNVDLFETLRQDAYRAYRKQFAYDGEKLYNYLVSTAKLLNESSEVPLPAAEVASEVRSIVRWVCSRFSDEGFVRWQTSLANRRWAKSAGERTELAEMMLALHDAGVAVKDIAPQLGMSYEACKKSLQRAKKARAESA